MSSDPLTSPSSLRAPRLHGEMVALRPVEPADLETLRSIGAATDVERIMGLDPEASSMELERIVLRSGEPEEALAWAVTRLDSGELIGVIFLSDWRAFMSAARLQIVLGPGYRGRGYSRDAIPPVLTYAFAPTGLGLYRIWMTIPETNARARSVYESLGFTVEGTLRDAFVDGGERHDGSILGMLAAENVDPGSLVRGDSLGDDSEEPAQGEEGVDA